MGKLTARHVQTLGDGMHADGGGLYLHVRGEGRSWVFRWKREGQQRKLGLGSVSARPLAEARRVAADLRNALLNGKDPKARLRELAGQAEQVPAFEQAALRLIDAKREGWRNPKHAQQWANSLRDYVFPKLGPRKVDAIGLADVVAVLTPIWTTKTETATRVRQRIEAVLDYCIVHGWRGPDNPARWRGMLDKVLPKPEKLRRREHFAAVPYADMPHVVQALRQQRGTSALALQFIILTACRSNEARSATWAEIDLKARAWNVPAERMKAGRAHRVPLSDEAVRVLEQAAALRMVACDLVFPSPTGRVMSDVAVSKALRRIRADATVHGMRAAFKTWASERGRYPARLVEVALAHANPDKTEAAYERTDLFEQRRRLMQDWASHCCPTRAAVVPLRTSGATA